MLNLILVATKLMAEHIGFVLGAMHFDALIVLFTVVMSVLGVIFGQLMNMSYERMRTDSEKLPMVICFMLSVAFFFGASLLVGLNAGEFGLFANRVYHGTQTFITIECYMIAVLYGTFSGRQVLENRAPKFVQSFYR